MAILGDMSGSMDVAIRTSNIIASLLTAVAKAQLVFFDDRVEIPDFMPSTVREVRSQLGHKNFPLGRAEG